MELRPPTPPPFEPVMCVACIYASPRLLDPTDDEESPVALDCRRFPPQLVSDIDVDGGLVVSQVWPQMAEGDWCGEGVDMTDNQEANDE